MTLSTKSTTTSELPLRCCTTTLTMAYHHSHSRMLYLLPLLFLLLPHPCITAASWIIASLDYHCLFGPQPLFGLPRYFWITAVSTHQTKQSVTPISAFLFWLACPKITYYRIFSTKFGVLNARSLTMSNFFIVSLRTAGGCCCWSRNYYHVCLEDVRFET